MKVIISHDVDHLKFSEHWRDVIMPKYEARGFLEAVIDSSIRPRTRTQLTVRVGDEVRTIGGIYGTIRSEDDESFTIDIGGGSTMRISRRAVAERLGDDSE